MAGKKNQYHQEPTAIKFDPSVDSGPLPIDADVATREAIQGERIRRQIQSHLYPKPKKRGM